MYIMATMSRVWKSVILNPQHGEKKKNLKNIGKKSKEKLRLTEKRKI